MVKYHEITNASLATVLATLESYNVGAGQIVQIFHNGTEYVAIYTTQ